MGLFDKFRRRVLETVDATDTEGMLADAASTEAEAAIAAREALHAKVEQGATPGPAPAQVEEDWEAPDEGWEDPDDGWEQPEEETTPPASPAPRPRSTPNVALSMMRSTTGRQLVEVASTPRGSTLQANLVTEAGGQVNIDLGGGVVQDGGRVISRARRWTTFWRNWNGCFWNPTFRPTR